MPRVQITHNTVRPTDNPAVVDELPRRNVHVSWNRAGGEGALAANHPSGWVQVAIDMTVGDLRQMLDTAEGGEQQIRIVSEVLERRDVNKTIQTLRRARDVAYGKDA
ncbi:hypothetical protein [Microbacterium sp. gxy059]|uniref:hypothetical protein n=1 Tax=Microbacterium sp. gxy059 TaxID=2957199 RepID=UPI003D997797